MIAEVSQLEKYSPDLPDTVYISKYKN